jgi:predicted ATPase
MRNVFIGSHGTGKTTLCKVLKKLDSSIAIRDGVSRPVKIARDKTGMTPYQEQAVINELTKFYWEYNKDFDNIFLARSPLDVEVYSRVFDMEDLADEMENWIRTSGMLNEDVNYFYLPIEFEIEDDGVRFVDVELQKKVDEELQKSIKKYNIKVTKLTGSVEDRIKQIYQAQ